ncbi:MAG: trehalase family glycosidase, partial [Chitinophagales bacterium]
MPPSTTIVIEDALQELFTDLHASKLFADGKVISDVVLKASPEVILVAYRTAKQAANFDLMAFFNAHFEKSPELESNYQSDTSLSVEEHIRRLWPVLTRQVNTITKGKYSTRIPLPYPYIVPGGRFNEIYYWDSYFTMLGLQTHGNVDRIECMVNNFSWLIEEYGFIPNGNRTYFLGRSQPPFYALMVDLLAQEKGDEILLKYLPTLEKEYDYWMKGGGEIENVTGSNHL